MKLARIIILATILPGCALTNIDNYRGGQINETYPKASGDASILYQLQSNKSSTHFFVDGKELGVSRHLKVYINDQAHTIMARPDGCVEKEEYIQPPYSSLAPLGFTYLLGECGENQTATPRETLTNNQPQAITINIKNSPEIKIVNKQDSHQKSQIKVQQSETKLNNLPPFPGSGRHYALIIDKNDNTEMTASVSETEAREVARLLESMYGFNIQLFLNAKLPDIKNAIAEFVAKISQDDSFVIYSTHFKDRHCQPRITSFSHVRANQFLANTGC